MAPFKDFWKNMISIQDGGHEVQAVVAWNHSMHITFEQFEKNMRKKSGVDAILEFRV